MPDITHTYTHILLGSRYLGTGATHTWTSKLGTRSGLSWRWECPSSGLFSSQVLAIKMFYWAGDATLGRQHDYKCCCPPRFVITFLNLLSMQTICHWCSPPQLTLTIPIRWFCRRLCHQWRSSLLCSSQAGSIVNNDHQMHQEYTIHANSQDPLRLIKFSLNRRSLPLTSMDRWTNR